MLRPLLSAAAWAGREAHPSRVRASARADGSQPSCTARLSSPPHSSAIHRSTRSLRCRSRCRHADHQSASWAAPRSRPWREATARAWTRRRLPSSSVAAAGHFSGAAHLKIRASRRLPGLPGLISELPGGEPGRPSPPPGRAFPAPGRLLPGPSRRLPGPGSAFLAGERPCPWNPSDFCSSSAAHPPRAPAELKTSLGFRGQRVEEPDKWFQRGESGKAFPACLLYTSPSPRDS